MKPKLYIASCSFGKDSIATILLALENNEPLDRVVFAEVMFDHERGISGEIPEHIEWIYNTAIPKLEGMGVNVDVVRAKKDYKWFFKEGVITKGKWKGFYYGFPIGAHCVVNRECKSRLILRYYKQFEGYEVCQYVGIASDERLRLKRLGKIKYHYWINTDTQSKWLLIYADVKDCFRLYIKQKQEAVAGFVQMRN